MTDLEGEVRKVCTQNHDAYGRVNAGAVSGADQWLPCVHCAAITSLIQRRVSAERERMGRQMGEVTHADTCGCSLCTGAFV